MKVPPEIFKAYDIRGIYPDQLNEETVEKISRAFVEFIKPSRVVVGHDTRLSSPSLTQAVIKGITEQAIDVIDIGLASTDYFYYACGQLGTAGLMVTASHNPKEYNGIKMVKKMPFLLSGEEGIQDIRQIVEAESWSQANIKGQVAKRDLRDDYKNYVLSLVDVKDIKPLKVIADAANGVAGVFAAEAYAALPIKLTALYFEPDGNFPNHGLDPLKEENRQELEARVVADKADLGFAFDGDGDRFFVIDDTGQFVPGDFLTALLAQNFLAKEPGAKIIYDVRASWCVRDLITEAGGIPLMNRVGHAFIKKRMSDEGAIFGGEVSGHYYFKNFFHADSGLVPSLAVLELLSKSGKKMSELLAPLRAKYFISGEINSKVSDQQAVLNQLKESYNNGKVYELDGLSVEYDDWHFNVRPSNTEPLLRLNLEALDENLMIEKRDEVLAIIRQ